jgi:WD40-like Beta Propeller Repeat
MAYAQFDGGSVQFGIDRLTNSHPNSTSMSTLCGIFYLMLGISFSITCASCSPQYQDSGLSGFSVLPNGSGIIFGSSREGAGNLYWLAADGSKLARLTSGTLSAGAPAISPDGRSVVFVMHAASSDPWQIYSMSAAGLELQDHLKQH